ncbi:undecaprenyl diphosphate synthase family protein, partial [Candidatus Woesearchaeota archaeon]|nr:undecaprenyl diphosphate synthase family protein [Candidatus Woesearchaeota archaeon]
IRTSGEKRTSGFMLWQSSYAELYFSEKNWPEFGKDDFDKALKEYSQRNRRFGK